MSFVMVFLDLRIRRSPYIPMRTMHTTNISIVKSQWLKDSVKSALQDFVKYGINLNFLQCTNMNVNCLKMYFKVPKEISLTRLERGQEIQKIKLLTLNFKYMSDLPFSLFLYILSTFSYTGFIFPRSPIFACKKSNQKSGRVKSPVTARAG